MREQIRRANYKYRPITLGLIILLLSVGLGNRACDDGRRATISCEPVELNMEPGACVEFPNPCAADGLWATRPDIDGLELDPKDDAQRALIAAEEISLKTIRNNPGTFRSICVGANAQLMRAFIPFRYGLGQNWGGNGFDLTIAHPFTVEVTASRTTISVGEFSQLLARPTGGIAPYFYTWGPNTGLDHTDIAAPVASPNATVTYSVGVRDSGGQEVFGSVTVFVGAQMTVTANPSTIVAGDASQLNAIAVGGSPPYTYSWTPTDTLTNPADSSPIATPTTTTTYNVTVTDTVGAVLHGSVTVTVLPAPALTALFTFNVNCCPEILNVNAGASIGNINTYTWDLSWTPANPDLVTVSPRSSFNIREVDRGTITLTVTDFSGHTATTTRNYP